MAALGVRIADTSRDAGFGALVCALDALVERHEFERALGVIEQFHAAAPGWVPAFERQAQLCRAGRYGDQLYDVENRLADLYLVGGRFADALGIAERLQALRVDVEHHRAQVAEASAGLGRSAPGTPDVTAQPAPTEAFDLAEFAASLGLPASVEAHPRQQEQEAGPASESDVIEVDLVAELNALAGPDGHHPGSADSVAAESAGVELDDVFSHMRRESGQSQIEADAIEAYDAAAVHYNEGRIALAVECLRRAGRDSSLRFRASVMLGRIALQQANLDEGIAWFERASEAPAPSVQAARRLLYELGDTLERKGEQARARAVFLELQSAEPGYRDVEDRLLQLRESAGTGHTDVRPSRGSA